MRILIFSTTYFPLVGGAEVALREITNRMPDVEFDLICAKIKPELSSIDAVDHITVHRVGFGHPIDKCLLPILGPIKALRLGRFDVVWSLLASYGGFAALTYTWIRPKAKMLLTLQEGDPLEHYAKRAGGLTFLHRSIFKRADAVQAISSFLGDWATRMGFKGTPVIVPNGVDLGRFQQNMTPSAREELRKTLGFATEDIILVTASRLSLKNGVDDLIRSLVKLPATHKALIIGDGEDHEKLRVLTEQKGLTSRVIFLGTKSHEVLPGLLHVSDVFVRASLSEALGNSFLEAMAAGIPIVGTPVGGIPDFLTDGATGVFCKPRDPDSIAAAVTRIMTEPGLREKLVLNGKQLVREKYGWDDVTSRIRSILRSLADSEKSS